MINGLRFKIIQERKNRGFSLLELLVVIGIIAILTALGTVSFTTAQKKTRDSRRLSDLKEIQNALETYHAVNGAYPGGAYPGGIDDLEYFSGGSVPVDPKKNIPYIPESYGADIYSICADLEMDGTHDGTNQDKCVNNLQ